MSAEPFDIDRTGDFQAEITEYGLQKADSGSVGIRFKAKLTAMWNPETNGWEDWTEFNAQAWGSSWIVKRDGTIHKPAVEALVKYAGWDGNLKSVVENTWVPTACQVSIGSEVYNDQTQFRISFVNAFDRVPGANVGNVTSDALKELENRFGSSLRAVVGNVKRNTSPPAAVNGGPKKPPARSAAPPADKQLETVPPDGGDDGIPF